MNGSGLLLYIDNDKLLYSKSHSFSFSGSELDISTKLSDISEIGESYYWESANLNWESFNTTWDEVVYDASITGWKEYMVGSRSASFSAEGLFQIGTKFQTWDTTDYYWELFNIDWEDGAIEPNPSINLDDLIITGAKIKFEILDVNMNSVFVGTCYVSSYELVANNEGAIFYNADFNVTSGVT
jgi:hypothetical protein|tara:strand:- start:5569 stop:6120 length:552 start_codon:yes stop_codon:yes gene_type:complete